MAAGPCRFVFCLSWYIFVYIGYIFGIFLVFFWYICWFKTKNKSHYNAALGVTDEPMWVQLQAPLNDDAVKQLAHPQRSERQQQQQQQRQPHPQRGVYSNAQLKCIPLGTFFWHICVNLLY